MAVEERYEYSLRVDHIPDTDSLGCVFSLLPMAARIWLAENILAKRGVTIYSARPGQLETQREAEQRAQRLQREYYAVPGQDGSVRRVVPVPRIPGGETLD